MILKIDNYKSQGKYAVLKSLISGSPPYCESVLTDQIPDRFFTASDVVMDIMYLMVFFLPSYVYFGPLVQLKDGTVWVQFKVPLVPP